jgi:hypothetical protein
VPKEKEAQTQKGALTEISDWSHDISNYSEIASRHEQGRNRLDLAEAKEILQRFIGLSDRHAGRITYSDEQVDRSKNLQQGRANRVEKLLRDIEEELTRAEFNRKKEGSDLTPEQRAKLQVQGWNADIHRYRQLLADHMTGEKPMDAAEIQRNLEGFDHEATYYRHELEQAVKDPANNEWATRLERSGLDAELYKLRRFTTGTIDRLDAERTRQARMEQIGTPTGWNDLHEAGELLGERAGDVEMHYGWLAGQVDKESEETALEEKGRALAAELRKKAKKLTTAAKKQKTATAEHFKTAVRTGVGFTRHQSAKEPEENVKHSKWGWEDLTGRLQGSGLSNPMDQVNWDAIQTKHPMEGMPSNFSYMGPTDIPSLTAEAHRAATRLKARVPAWLQDRIQNNGGEYVWSAAPPYRLGFKNQADYDAWIAPRDEDRKKSNDTRHWDRVGGFYRHADKKGYSQVGESGQSGTVDLELHEYGHMVDFLFAGGTGHDLLSAKPEFVSIWKDLHPWLDNYMTKDDNAKELWAEGFAVFSESEENRKQMLSKDSPEPMQRLGRYFQRFLNEDTHNQVGKSLRLYLGRDRMKDAENRAKGTIKENGEDLLWDSGENEGEGERHEHFPTLFLKTPRKAEKDTDNG